MTARPDANRRLVWRLLAVVVTMGALSWAAVPFYSWFCQVTGFAGTTQVASQGADRVLDRTVRVRFDANVMPDLGWTFRPMQTEMTVRLGETAMAYYEAVNTSDQTVTGSATYNVAPDDAGYFFEKIECFCFTEQTLAPGERIEMPLTFFVSPTWWTTATRAISATSRSATPSIRPSTRRRPDGDGICADWTSLPGTVC